MTSAQRSRSQSSQTWKLRKLARLEPKTVSDLLEKELNSEYLRVYSS